MIQFIFVFASILPWMLNAESTGSLYYDLAMEYKDVAPSCVIPTVKNAPSMDETPISLWNSLTREEKSDVAQCHTLMEPRCYNSFFKFEDRGYSNESLYDICSFYQQSWKPCCERTDPRTWRGSLKIYCPLYVANCLGRTTHGVEMTKINYQSFKADEKKDKFSHMCPQYHTLCAQTPKMIKATAYTYLCISLNYYRRIRDCDTHYNATTQAYNFEGCKKYKKYCSNLVAQS